MSGTSASPEDRERSLRSAGGADGASSFADLLADRMARHDPPMRQRDLAQWLGIERGAISAWFHRGSVPREPRVLYTLADIFGDAPDLWFRAAGRAMPPTTLPGRSRTPEQDILEDMQAIRDSPFYRPAEKQAILATMERALRGYSVRQELLDQEMVVDGTPASVGETDDADGDGEGETQPLRTASVTPHQVPETRPRPRERSDRPQGATRSGLQARRSPAKRAPRS